MKKGLLFGLAGAALLAACSADSLGVPNPNSPPVAGAGADPAAVSFQATGILRQLRGSLGGYITTTARFGREGYIYTPNEGRNTSHYLIGLLGENRLDPSGFATGVWGGNYGNLRDVFNFMNTVASQPDVLLSPTQKTAAYGFARTVEALELLYIIAGRDSLGAVVQINLDPQELAPFVSRDSVYNYILNTLDAADAQLAAGGAAFPFTLHAGFAGFNTPTTFRQFNRAIAARAAVYAARGCVNGTCTVVPAMYTRAATALAASFLNRTPANAAAMNAGVNHVYSTATGDATNGVGQNADFLTHPSFATDIAVGDARSAKWAVLVDARNAPQSLGIPTNLRMNRYASNTTVVPIIRNEELLLLDAEVRWFTNTDKPGAITDLQTVRTVSGGAGIGATSATAASTDAQFIDALLYERRFSLLAEGHRWVDHRRFGRLSALPLDLPAATPTNPNYHFVARVMPVPQAECLVRVRANNPALLGPGC